MTNEEITELEITDEMVRRAGKMLYEFEWGEQEGVFPDVPVWTYPDAFLDRAYIVLHEALSGPSVRLIDKDAGDDRT